MEKLKMVDLYGQYARIKTDIDRAIEEVLTSTAFIQGPQVSTFAAELASYTGAGMVIPCANGTDALQIAMMALDIKAGDEVILPVHTYVATAEVIALLGIRPVFVDVDKDNFNLDVTAIERVITSRTKAIVPVHLYGQCADMESILEVAARHKLHVIEDAAQALGAEFIFKDGRRKQAGTMGTIGTTSFFPSKNLGCFGDGGAIFTNDLALGEKIRMISNHGQKVKYKHDIIGCNSRLDTLQAAILSVKLKHIADYMKRRSDVATTYDRDLSKVAPVKIPFRTSYSTHVFNQYTIRVPKRDELQKFLAGKNIPTMIYYPIPLHFQTAFRQDGFGEGSFPVTEELSKTVISLPIHTELIAAELDHVTSAIKEFYA
jgi:UDP-2-acetamido-2-deoxy-ribo-hexuluronate aminotransferase